MGPVPFHSPSRFSFSKLLHGALAGFVATAPMSVSMLIGWRLLPNREKYHLPPRLITEEITERVGIEDRMSENELIGLTVVSHFSYGALFGATYALFEHNLPMHTSMKGALAGVGLWMGSYLGWLPAMGILTPATRHPWRRNLLMIVAHAIWGVTMGELTRKLSATREASTSTNKME
jgi:putative membrane protein